MDFGQQRLQQQNAARQMMYQNSGYQFERRDKKTLIIDIEDRSTDKPLSSATEFSVDLFEPLIVDKLSDVYLDNFTTYNSLLCDKNDRSAFSLQINEFNVNSNVASSGDGQNMFNRILIPNENNLVSDAHSAVIHKGKKMNYVCSINPGKISTITGKITDLAGNSMFSTGNGADGGKLHSLKLDTGLTGDRAAGVTVTIAASGGSGNFVLAYHHAAGSTVIYFYSSGSTVPNFDSARAVTVTGESAINSTAKYYRAGDFPRFTAEFVIVARD